MTPRKTDTDVTATTKQSSYSLLQLAIQFRAVSRHLVSPTAEPARRVGLDRRTVKSKVDQHRATGKSAYILMLLPSSLFLCISAFKAMDNYRRRHPFMYGLLAFAGAIYGAYATVLSGDPIDPLRGYIPRDEEQVFAVILGLLFTLSGIVGQMRAAPESPS